MEHAYQPLTINNAAPIEMEDPFVPDDLADGVELRQIATTASRRHDNTGFGMHPHDAEDLHNRDASDHTEMLPNVDHDSDKDPLLQTLDYDNYVDYMNEASLQEEAVTGWTSHKLTVIRLGMVVLIAFLSAVIGYAVRNSVTQLHAFKTELVLSLLTSGRPFVAYLALISVSCLLALVAVVATVCVAPKAKGGGFPYVVAYLNGTYLANYFTFRIVAVKMVGLVLAIAAGLPLGMESPFVFIGAGVAMSCVRVARLTLGRWGRLVTNINEERIFIAGGAAAGLAVAFSAPLAGVLIAVEAATAFVSSSVTIRIFACAMLAQFFSDISISNFSAVVRNHNLIFGAPDASETWQFSEVFAFTLLSVIGALLGSLAIWLNLKLTPWRRRVLPTANWQGNVLQVLALTAACVTVWFILPYLWLCRPLHGQCSSQFLERCEQTVCPAGSFSDIGTIVYSTPETIARILFDRVVSPDNDVRISALLVYGVFFFVLMAVTYGSYVPGGLFIPSIIVGGTYGRALGMLLRGWGVKVNPGVYALLGAGSMLGGFNRLALPIVVMLMEMTGDATYLLPIMMTSFVAKLLGDLINEPLYAQHMKLENIPVLGETLPRGLERLKASDLMTPATRAVEMIDQVARVLDVLARSPLVIIPVTRDGYFAGMITRKAVVYALTRTRLFASRAEAERELLHMREMYASRDMEGLNHLSSKDMLGVPQVNSKHHQSWVNLTPYVDAGAFSAQEETPSARILQMFRRVGSSALCVTDLHNHVLGVVTRRDLLFPPKRAHARTTSLQSYIPAAIAAQGVPRGSGTGERKRASSSAELSAARPQKNAGSRSPGHDTHSLRQSPSLSGRTVHDSELHNVPLDQ